METEGPSPSPPAQIIGNLFVEQYYHILHTSPHLVHKFYQDSSMLSRPGNDNVMTSVTSMEEINSKILSFDLKDYKLEILTADAQYSCKEGVIVLVIGCLIGNDNMRRKFSQTFFLAQQDTGYYVLNDVFRFVDTDEPLGVASVMSPDPEPVPVHVPDQPLQSHTSTHDAEGINNGNVIPTLEVINDGEVCDPSNARHLDVGAVVASLSQSDVHSVAESASNVQENSQKISYASVLMKESRVTSPVHVPTRSIVVESSSTEQQPRAPAVQKATAPQSSGASQNSNCYVEVTANGVYIGNLPTDVTVQQLEAEFKVFGPIKRDGIQVRKFKEDGFCYGFVEFEISNSARSAIQARKIRIGNKDAHIEEKRITTRVGNGREKFSSGRGGFRDDNLKGRRNYGGGRGFQNGGSSGPR